MTDQLFGVPQPAGAAGAPDDAPPERVEVLLPFLLDGDTRTIDAAGRDRTTVGWLMTDGREPGNHLGYVWLELRSSDEDGHDRFCTAGAGLKSSSATRQTTTWYFLVEDVRVGAGLALEDDGECFSLERLKSQLGEQVTTSAAEHRRRVAHRLFGLRDEARYANLLHLLHRLRDPNIGNRIEAGELAAVLRDALPPPSDTSLEVGAERFDALKQIRVQLERTQRTATALGRFMASYVDYARTVLRGRAEAVLAAVRQHRRATREAAAREAETAEANLRRDEADLEVRRLRDEEGAAAAELEGLQQSDAYKQHLQLVDRRKAVHAADHAAAVAETSAELARRGLREAEADLVRAGARVSTAVAELVAARAPMLRLASGAGVDTAVVPAAPDASTGEAALAVTRLGVVAALDVARGRRRLVEAVRVLARAATDARRTAATADDRRPVLSRAVRRGVRVLRRHRRRGAAPAPPRRRVREGRRAHPRSAVGAPRRAGPGLPSHERAPVGLLPRGAEPRDLRGTARSRRAGRRPRPLPLGRTPATPRRAVTPPGPPAGAPAWSAILEPGLGRLWDAVAARLQRNGLRPHGIVRLEALDRAERRALAGILGRPVTAARTSVDLADEISTTVLTAGLRPPGSDLLDAGSRRAMVYTAGNPRTVVNALLAQLAAGAARLHYRGDFDWPGVGIANRLIEAHGASPWRMGAGDYEDAIARAAPALDSLPVLDGRPLDAAPYGGIPIVAAWRMSSE